MRTRRAVPRTGFVDVAMHPADTQKARLREEARQLAEALGAGLRQLEGQSLRQQVVNALFRQAHSLKGLAGLLDAAEAVLLADAIEDALDALRQGRVTASDQLIAASLRAADRCHRLGPQPGTEAEALVAAIHAALATAGVEWGPDPLDELLLDPAVRAALTEYETARLREGVRAGRAALLVEAAFSLDDFDGALESLPDRLGEAGELVATLPGPPHVEAEMPLLLLVTWALDVEALRRRLEPLPVQVVPVPCRAPRADAVGAEGPPRLRVRCDRLGEVEAAARALIAGLPGHPEAARLEAMLARLRLVPAAELAGRVDASVRSLARAWERPVELDVAGGTLEIPLELEAALAEPLLHLVRNAIDHGIEPPAERVRNGKPAVGKLCLAFRETGGRLEIALADDGRGIDRAAVAAAALERGAASPEALQRLDETALLALVFAPGVTTAASAGASGRGVGLDVVRTAVEARGGSVAVESRKGHGTTFRLLLPL